MGNKHSQPKRKGLLYLYIYNTARFFPCFPLYGLAVYTVHIHGFFFYKHGSHVEPHQVYSFDWL